MLRERGKGYEGEVQKAKEKRRRAGNEGMKRKIEGQEAIGKKQREGGEGKSEGQ